MKKELKKLDSLYEQLKKEVSSSTMDLVSEIVELELLIESECNQ